MRGECVQHRVLGYMAGLMVGYGFCNDVHGAQTAKHKASEASQNGAAAPAEVDLAADRHRGQFALRKLYHESERLVVVLYTSPSCGPCRTLKPIFSKVVDEYSGKVGPRAVTLGI